MQLNDQEKELFRRLSDSELGKQLVEYLTRFQSGFCDVRNIGEEESPASIKRMAFKIQNDLIDKIQLQTRSKEVKTSEFE